MSPLRIVAALLIFGAAVALMMDRMKPAMALLIMGNLLALFDHYAKRR
jgi:hypothetical protein